MPAEDSEPNSDQSEPEPNYEYDSGPFCRHYGDPSYCEEKCAVCGHECHEHYDACDHEDEHGERCRCPTWYEKVPSEPLIHEAALAQTLPEPDEDT